MKSGFLSHKVFGNTQSNSCPLLLMFLICLIYQTLIKENWL